MKLIPSVEIFSNKGIHLSLRLELFKTRAYTYLFDWNYFKQGHTLYENDAAELNYPGPSLYCKADTGHTRSVLTRPF